MNLLKLRSRLARTAVALLAAPALALMAGVGAAHAVDCSNPTDCGLDPNGSGIGDLNPYQPADSGTPQPTPVPRQGLINVSEALLSVNGWTVSDPSILTTNPGTLFFGGFPNRPFRDDRAVQTITIPSHLQSPDFSNLGPYSTEKVTVRFSVNDLTTVPLPQSGSDVLGLSILNTNGGFVSEPASLSNFSASQNIAPGNTAGTSSASFTVDLSAFAGQTIQLNFDGFTIGGQYTTLWDVTNMSVTATQTVKVVIS